MPINVNPRDKNEPYTSKNEYWFISWFIPKITIPFILKREQIKISTFSVIYKIVIVYIVGCGFFKNENSLLFLKGQVLIN